MKEHEIIERVYRYASIAFEIKWQYISKVPKIKNIVLLVLSKFIETKDLAELYNVQQITLTGTNLNHARKSIRKDFNIKTKYNFILNSCYN